MDWGYVYTGKLAALDPAHLENRKTVFQDLQNNWNIGLSIYQLFPTPFSKFSTALNSPFALQP
jgi:hypothetical protein